MRLFVALDLPDDVRAALPRPEAPWRAVAPEKLHVTLVFIGDADPDDVDLSGVAPEVGPLTSAGAITLPPRRPRVLAVQFEDPTGACTRLQAAVAEAVGVDEGRPWLPHVTIGRTRERVRRDAPVPEVPSLEFLPTALTLYESRGGRYGPVYSVPSGLIRRKPSL